LALALLIIFAAYSLYQQFGRKASEQPEPSGVLIMTEMIDGDTGELSDGGVVRFLGIDTPERGEEFYFEAHRMSSELCRGKAVRLERDYRMTDKYDRELAYVFVEDTIMVNEVLVYAGLAHVYTFPADQKNMEYRRRFILAQMNAREAGRGIWSLPPPEPVEESYLGNANSFRFHRPGCRTLRRSDKSRLLEYPSRDDFLDLGFSPCRICKP
jgi:micrococcal nuclease